MKRFHLFIHPDGRLEAVKDGFSFPGAIFACFWLLWHKIWVHGTIALIIGFGIYVILPSPPAGYIMGLPYGQGFGIADIVNAVVAIGVGFLGNNWRMTSLLERGFESVSIENAPTPDGAKANYIRHGNRQPIEPTIL